MINTNIPTHQSPLILRWAYGQSIPSLKNNKTPVPSTAKDGSTFFRPVSNKSVKKFQRWASGEIAQQFDTSYFDPIMMPVQIGCWVRIAVHVAGDGIPNKDADNLYTTLQETLAGIALEDDRQISNVYFQREITKNSLLEHAKMWLWHWDDEKLPFLQQEYVFHRYVIGNNQSDWKIKWHQSVQETMQEWL